MYERPDGSWDWDREDADRQTADLVAAGREAHRDHKRAIARILKGDLAGAASICHHGSRLGDLCRECGALLGATPLIALAGGPASCVKCCEPLTISGREARCLNGHDLWLKADRA